MKSFILVSLALSAAASSSFEKRQAKNVPLWKAQSDRNNGPYGKIADPNPKRRFNLPAANKTPGSKTVKIRYGPYSIPGQKWKNSKGHGGMLDNYPDRFLEMPCTECSLTGMTAGLEYLDGKTANINTDLWLHHFVLYNQGPGRVDETCKNTARSLPHIGIGFTPLTSERIFSSGNERSPISFVTSGVTDAGYMINKEDKFHMIVDLMNTSNEDKKAYLTITYDYVMGHPKGWSDVKMIWFDVDNCNTSDVKPPTQTGNFTVDWTYVPDFSGEVINTVGHLHDGGQRLTVSKNGRQVCDSVASYGGSPEFKNSGKQVGGHSHKRREVSRRDGAPKAATEHISFMTMCEKNSFLDKKMNKGEQWSIKAYYDYKQNAGVLHDNAAQDDVMGIALMYVKVPRKNVAKTA